MRSLYKTGTYSIMHFVVAAAVAYAVTGDWRAALAISLIEPAVQTIAYAVHERVWERAWPKSPADAAAGAQDAHAFLHKHG